MSDLAEELQQIPGVGDTADEPPVDHDPTNGRWLEKEFADALETWGYLTARNEHIFGLETDVIGRRAPSRVPTEKRQFQIVLYPASPITPSVVRIASVSWAR